MLIVGRKGLDNRKDIEIVILRRVLLLGSVGEDGLTSLSHLSEYPTCPKAMWLFGIQRRMYLTGFVEQVVKDSYVPHEGLDFFVHEMMTGCPVRVHPFCSAGGWLKGRWLPSSCLGFPSAFHCAILLYYVCQICKVENVAPIEGVEDALVRTVAAKD